MEKVTIEDVDSRMSAADVRRGLSDDLGTTDMAINYYELAPGDSFAFGYHAHVGQEEVFYIQSGSVTFETEDGDVVVTAGEIIRFAPGDYQRGVNEGDERVVALALGAPQDSELDEMRRDCEECGERTANTLEMADSGEELVTYCLGCGAETGRFD
ncbi:Cupin domain-containing protein [Haladaptatus litoreus]|uniref:Cupin domain-containing protein n=1 Tax=Haladaptatus litoreus TaxID=553468 RepID=A0A1N7BKK2_9EURY|nr:cupin domain-containing protein [Haladaptatus litoreus]SIR51897.1 Cupin domain-containing protein [Haladaptatus litoreus]